MQTNSSRLSRCFRQFPFPTTTSFSIQLRYLFRFITLQRSCIFHAKLECMINHRELLLFSSSDLECIHKTLRRDVHFPSDKQRALLATSKLLLRTVRPFFGTESFDSMGFTFVYQGTGHKVRLLGHTCKQR